MADGNIQAPMVSVDDGEVNFSDSGLEILSSLISDPVPEETAPEAPPENAKAPETPPVLEEKEEVPPQQKFKIKVDGQEEEVPLEELVARAQMGTHFTKEMQALRERERALSPYEGLVKQLQQDPNLNKHIADYWSHPPQPEQQPVFDDPIEQLKWETKQETIREFEKVLQPIREQQRELSRQQIIDKTKAAVMSDPMFRDVHTEIGKYVQSLPRSVGETIFQKLDQDPQAYLEMYQTVRDRLAVQKPNETTGIKTTPKEDHAPLLESGGSAPPESAVVEQRTKIDKAKARALRDGKTESLQEFLITGGFLKHLA